MCPVSNDSQRYRLYHATVETVYQATVGVSFPELGPEYERVIMDRHSLQIGEGYRPVAEDDPSPLVASPPRTPRTPPSEVRAGAERSPAEATTSRLGKVYTSPI